VEIAAILDTTPTAVNSVLQRARATLEGPVAPGPAGLDPQDPVARRLVEAYVTAFERADVAAITQLVTADVVLEMPPVATWFAGRDDFGRFMTTVFARRGGGWRMTVTAANGQPALVAYAPGTAGTLEMHSYQVLDVQPAGIQRTTVFYDQALMVHLGVPAQPT
jgi:RNA polymerase sigma-70 factor (ECF subfamily)